GTGVAMRARAQAAYARVPLAFEPNVGQSDRRVRFLARGPGAGVFFTPNEAVLALAGRRKGAGAALRLRFPGAAHPVLHALQRLPGKVNYFVGRERSRWRTDVPTYARVRYGGLWPGIDATFYGNGSHLEYDLRIAASPDPR